MDQNCSGGCVTCQTIPSHEYILFLLSDAQGFHKQVDICPHSERDRCGTKVPGGGIKDRVDKSMGIVTLIVEAFARSRPTESLRFGKLGFFILKGEKIVLVSAKECLHKG